jgi:hypothetical protein
MKSILLLFVSLNFSMMVQAQVSKTIEVTAGGLKTALTAEELNTVTSLTLTGTMDARDFKILRDEMPRLSVLDMSGTIIAEYTGNNGTISNIYRFYEDMSIPAYCFYNPTTGLGKRSLKIVLLPLGLRTIESSAFKSCTGLSSMNIPSAVTSIEYGAFLSCSGLTSVSIPASVTFIGNAAFAGIGGIITVDVQNKRYSGSDGILFNKNKTIIIKCPNSISGNYTVPTSVSVIGNSAFFGCEKLESVVLPKSVVSIESQAFFNCDNLVSITVKSGNPFNQTNYPDIFSGVESTTCILYVPFGSKHLYAAANPWKDFANILEMTGFRLSSESLRLAANPVSADSIAIRSDVSWTVSSSQFWLTVNPTSGTGLQTLTFTAEDNAMDYPRTAEVTISADGVDSQTITVTQKAAPTQLNVAAGDLGILYSSEYLSSITSLKLTGTIDARDFYYIRDYMPLLTDLDLSEAEIVASSYYGSNSNDIPRSAFSFLQGMWGRGGKTSLRSIVLPSSLTSIGDSAFSGCSGLTSVSIPSTVTSIGYSAFYGCSGLTSVSLPSSVTSIGNYAFSGCSGLTSIIIPLSITAINYCTFQNCTSLESITIPPSIYDIGSYSFSGCTGLSSVTICSVVFNIYDGAFSNCSSLKSIYTNSTFPQYLYSSSGVFSGVNTTDCILYVPHGSKGVYSSDNQWGSFKNIVEMLIVELSATALNIAYSQGSSTTTNIVSNLSWTVRSDQTWLTVNPSSGTGDQILTFTADANPTINPRIATVTVSADGVDSQAISVTQEAGPTALADLAENSTQFKCYPNPFTDEISIEIQNPKQSEISVDIYNLAGERIKNLATNRKDEKLDLKWNGINDSGQRVATGVYICKVNNRSKQLIYQGGKGKK